MHTRIHIHTLYVPTAQRCTIPPSLTCQPLVGDIHQVLGVQIRRELAGGSHVSGTWTQVEATQRHTVRHREQVVLELPSLAVATAAVRAGRAAHAEAIFGHVVATTAVTAAATTAAIAATAEDAAAAATTAGAAPTPGPIKSPRVKVTLNAGRAVAAAHHAWTLHVSVEEHVQMVVERWVFGKVRTTLGGVCW